ncbi:LacI family transcriptional regulator [Aquamicrobium sp. LC103]|nr:LacI family transcriptional regulator [Aquamicrobium sp. LC103]
MVLNDSEAPAIPAETRQRIVDAAKSLGYSPNRFAQALKTRRTMTIACIVPDITNPFYPSLIRGVQKAAQAQGYDVIAVNTDGLAEQERHFVTWAGEGRVDGVIGVFFNTRAPDLAALVDSDIPIVRIEASRKTGGDLAIDDLYVDSRAAARAVTEYLIGKGHRRIAMVAGIGGPQSERIEGYREAVAEIGEMPLVHVEQNFDEKGGLRAAEKLLAKEPHFSAVFAANDLMAIGVMQTLRERQIDIPGRVAVVGFDDISAARLVTPSLTTVTQFQDRMGERAAAILVERMQGKRSGPGTTEMMPFKLVERDSA